MLNERSPTTSHISKCISPLNEFFPSSFSQIYQFAPIHKTANFCFRRHLSLIRRSLSREGRREHFPHHNWLGRHRGSEPAHVQRFGCAQGGQDQSDLRVGGSATVEPVDLRLPQGHDQHPG